MSDLSKKRGTIAHYLTKHQDEIYACGNDVYRMKQVVLDLLRKDEIQDNPETPEAIRILSSCKGALFLSTLVTYMTGMKVSL